MRKYILTVLMMCLLAGCSNDAELKQAEQDEIEFAMTSTYISETVTDEQKEKLSTMYQNIFYPYTSQVGCLTYDYVLNELEPYKECYNIEEIYGSIVVTDEKFSGQKIIIHFSSLGSDNLIDSIAYDYSLYEITAHDNCHDGKGIRYILFTDADIDNKLLTKDSIEACEIVAFRFDVSHEKE